jgi:hypothetical protein
MKKKEKSRPKVLNESRMKNVHTTPEGLYRGASIVFSTKLKTNCQYLQKLLSL